jgi:hypothetical protein
VPFGGQTASFAAVLLAGAFDSGAAEDGAAPELAPDWVVQPPSRLVTMTTIDRISASFFFMFPLPFRLCFLILNQNHHTKQATQRVRRCAADYGQTTY